MKHLAYFLIKYWIRAGLFCYYQKIEVVGSERIPEKGPVLILSNHQNALMDVLLLATRCKRKPWFITRSDIFKGSVLNSLFGFLQMIPIYRIRDGKANLYKNQAIFERCSELLLNGEAILLFPEANHSLKRRVRPLSKGFTRIIMTALEKDPKMKLQLVPIGQNYMKPSQSGDAASLYVGNPIEVQEFMGSSKFVGDVKQEVFKALTALTTHIPENEYEDVISKLEGRESLYLKPDAVNMMISERSFPKGKPQKVKVANTVSRALFYSLNFPLVVLWRTFIKPKVPEVEFEATFKFGFAMITYPLFYGILLTILWKYFDVKTACLTVLGHAVINIILVKIGITSSDRRK
ncbi:lysophospholipid acyltransferase family protein [Flagellimonas nanhaiensis]|uniref:lysophospholipid acyltransferase family protein n=1 Tax=Flagellimonas nanhaiensis TaxID=2292706 RepID=UPI0015F25ABD|nr:lysophospholipid acyltransferase family protein [Allomuricauda nanhaiensis]